MRLIKIVLSLVQVQSFFVVSLYGILVHEDQNNDTTQKPLLAHTVQSPNNTENSSNTTQSTEIAGKNYAIKPNEMNSNITGNATTITPMPFSITAQPKKRNGIMSRFIGFNKANVKSNQQGFSPFLKNQRPVKNFVPSPELIVDSSYSSESNEKYISIKQAYALPARSIVTNRNSIANNKSDYTTFTVTTQRPNYVTEFRDSHSTSILPTVISTPNYAASYPITQNDKLPWPYPYQDKENEFKWKLLSPTDLSYHHGVVNVPYSSFTANTAFPTGYANYAIKTPTQAYQPYAFETPFSGPSYQPDPTLFPTYSHAHLPLTYSTVDPHAVLANPTPTYGLPPSDAFTYVPDVPPYRPDSIDYYAQTAYQQNNNSNFGYAKDLSIPSPTDLTHINKEVFWHTALKFLATALPIGLLISALSPNVIVVNANSTSPYPSPPPTLLGAVNFNNNNATRVRNERVTNAKLKPFDFLIKSKEYRNNRQIREARACENRYLCELGLLAVGEKNTNQSARTLYKTLWKISNEHPDQQSLNDMNDVFKAIQDKNCIFFQCNLHLN